MKELVNWLASLSLIITAIVSFSNNCSRNSFNNNISNVASNSNHFFISGNNNSKPITKLQIISNQLNYQLITSDTDLITGLVSRGGNTDSRPIIETKIKNPLTIHSSALAINITSDIIDFKNSYYWVQNNKGDLCWIKHWLLGFMKKPPTSHCESFKKADKKNLLKFALQHISVNCPLFTDSWSGYKNFKTSYPTTTYLLTAKPPVKEILDSGEVQKGTL